MAKDGVVAGLEVAEFVFEVVDASLTCELLAADGDAVTAGQRVLRIAGAAKSILIGERLLNFIQRMSGIASRRPISWLRSPAPNAPCLTPVRLRLACGNLRRWPYAWAGTNHRMGLYDMILVKDNHVDYAGSMAQALENVSVYMKAEQSNVPVVVEVRDAARLLLPWRRAPNGKTRRFAAGPDAAGQPHPGRGGHGGTMGRYHPVGGVGRHHPGQRLILSEAGVDYVNVVGSHSVKGMDLFEIGNVFQWLNSNAHGPGPPVFRWVRRSRCSTNCTTCCGVCVLERQVHERLRRRAVRFLGQRLGINPGGSHQFSPVCGLLSGHDSALEHHLPPLETEEVLISLEQFFPKQAIELFESTVSKPHSQLAGTLLSVGVVLLLYYASNGVNAILLGFGQSAHSAGHSRTGWCSACYPLAFCWCCRSCWCSRCS